MLKHETHNDMSRRYSDGGGLTQAQFDNAARTTISHREAAQPAADICADIVYERHNQMDNPTHMTPINAIVAQLGDVVRNLEAAPSTGQPLRNYLRQRITHLGSVRAELISLGAYVVAMTELVDADVSSVDQAIKYAGELKDEK